MYSPIVLEAFDAIFASSPVLEESETCPEPQTPKTAPCVTSTNETSDLLDSEESCDDVACQRHWYLHTRQWLHRQSQVPAINGSESLQLKALLSPAFGNLMDKPTMDVEIEVIEIDEGKA